MASPLAGREPDYNLPVRHQHHEIPLLPESDCASLVDAVDSLREHWISRWEGLPFWTLGAASYLDSAQEGFAAYAEKARATTPILDQTFSALYDRVCEALAELVDQPVELAEGLARPGFHIFDFHPDFMLNRASAHYDLQYELIEWSGIADVDRDSQISFTIPIALPAAGGGLSLWNLDWLEMRELSEEQRRERIREHRTPEELAYRIGTMFVHGGHRLHQMMPMRQGTSTDRRVTLQGHAISGGDRWLVYW